jgi:hypothetical protein
MEKKIFNKGQLHKESYNERVKNYISFAEDRFEEYCKTKGYSFKKLILNADDNLFDSPIPHWGKLGIMRNQPDYFCYNKEKQFYIELKASAKLKILDLKRYIAWENIMCDPKYTQYFICFSFADKMIIKTLSQILELIPQSKMSSYHEGNKYYILPL